MLSVHFLEIPGATKSFEGPRVCHSLTAGCARPFLDSRPRAYLQLTSNQKLRLGKIDDFVLHLFKFDIRSIAAAPRYEQATLFRDKLFHISVAESEVTLHKDKFLSYAQFGTLLKATKYEIAISFARKILHAKKEAQRNRYHSIRNPVFSQRSMRITLFWSKLSASQRRTMNSN